MAKMQKTKHINLFLFKKREKRRLYLLRDKRKSPWVGNRGHANRNIISQTSRRDKGVLHLKLNNDIDIENPKNRVFMVSLCNKIRATNCLSIHLDFQMEKIFAPGMLFLYAEIYKKINNGCKITCTYPSNRKSEKVLQYIGFFDMIKKHNRITTKDIVEPDIISWYVEKGLYLGGEVVSKFIDKFTDLSPEKDNKIYGALMELIGNAAEHAYNDNDQDKFWVMFGRAGKNMLTIVVGDLGKTIPGTMTNRIKSDEALIQKIARKINTAPRYLRTDGGLIRVASQWSKSGLWDEHRGLGLNEAIRKINALGGKLIIFSRGGIVQFPEIRESRSKRRHPAFENSINGTIITINIPLNLE